MPTPLGHALGGVIAGGVVAGSSGADADPWWRAAAVFALLGVAPDLDFIVGEHRQHSHSLGATLIVGAVAAGVTMMRAESFAGAPRARLRLALAAAAAYGSHLLLDAASYDTTPPLGVMAFWPFSSAFFQSPIPLFMAISRRYWLPGFLIQNLTAVAWELALLGPLATPFTRRATSSGPRATTPIFENTPNFTPACRVQVFQEMAGQLQKVTGRPLRLFHPALL